MKNKREILKTLRELKAKQDRRKSLRVENG